MRMTTVTEQQITPNPPEENKEMLPYLWSITSRTKIGAGDRVVQPGDRVSTRFKARVGNSQGAVYEENVSGDPVS